MSTRQRMMNYDNNRKDKFKGTSSQFGKVGRNIDRESEKPKLQQESFVSRPKHQQEDESSSSKSIREEIDELVKDEEKPTDVKSFEKKEAKPTVIQPPNSTEDDLITKYKAGGAFIKAWTSVDHIVIPQVIQPRKSSYIPNYLAASQIIHSMEICLDGNEELKWISPYFFFLPIRLYYSIMFYLQILKAKESAGKLDKDESTWFRSFKRTYPLESLPIVGPMVPYFSNIVSVKPNDDKYDYVYPTFKKNAGLTIDKGTATIGPEYYIQPCVAILAEFLRDFCVSGISTVMGKTNQDYNRFDDSGNMIPGRPTTQFRFAGIDFGATLTAPTSQVISHPALDNALPESRDRLKSIHNHWRRSKIIDMPPVQQTENFTTIGEALRMPSDFEWFEDCVHMATIQCKFFSDSTNMSQIPSTGGSEALVEAHITGANEKYAQAEEWFPRNWRHLQATFKTTRADTGPEQFANAEYALTNATISWTSNSNFVGSVEASHKLGPYWANREFEFQLDNPVPIARRITTTVQSQFYDARGLAS